MRLGFHVSVAGGFENLVRGAVRRRCTALQMFTSAPVQWARRKVGVREGSRLAQHLAELDITPHFVHASYLLNLSSPDRALRRRSISDLAQEVEAARRLGAAGVIVHLGSVGAGGQIEEGIARVAEAADIVCERVPEGPPVILENSAGQGNMVGSRLEHIARIIEGANCSERLRVCIDTAHAFGAGCAVHTASGLRRTIEEMDATFGLERMALLHVNDSLLPFASGRDR
ncbi:MAG TPA: deoxyribonuclease IV, partial [Armatimonadota bacterium]|nr:deoxyribonuclease IV [Armatimonadota bacterium]